MSDKQTGKRGFGGMTKEKQEEARQKSIATRAANKKLKEQKSKQATELRKEAETLINKAEMLKQQADELDGQCSSTKLKKKQESELVDEIDQRYRDSVSPQYLKILKSYAIQRGLTADELITPTFSALDILHDPRSTPKQKDQARKDLQQYENAKPAIKSEEDGETIGSFQDEFNNLMQLHSEIAPKR